MTPERVMEIGRQLAARIREETIRECAKIADDFLGADDGDVDTCIGIRDSILSLIEKKP